VKTEIEFKKPLCANFSEEGGGQILSASRCGFRLSSDKRSVLRRLGTKLSHAIPEVRLTSNQVANAAHRKTHDTSIVDARGVDPPILGACLMTRQCICPLLWRHEFSQDSIVRVTCARSALIHDQNDTYAAP